MRFVLFRSLGACAVAMAIGCASDDTGTPSNPASSGPSSSSAGVTQGTTGTGTTLTTGSTVGTSSTGTGVGSTGAGGAATSTTGIATTGSTSSATGSGGATSTGAGGSDGEGGSTAAGGAAGSGAGGAPEVDAGTAPRKIGGGCKSSADCDATLGLTCDLKLPSGMCTKACTGDADCGTTTLTGQHAGNVCFMMECYRGCTAAVPCVTSRTGYSCVGTAPTTFCSPPIAGGKKDAGP